MTDQRNPRNDDELPLSGARPVDDDVRGELEFHMQQRIADLMASGRTREQAISEARASFGDRAAVEAECREIESRRRTTKQRADRSKRSGRTSGSARACCARVRASRSRRSSRSRSGSARMRQCFQS